MNLLSNCLLFYLLLCPLIGLLWRWSLWMVVPCAVLHVLAVLTYGFITYQQGEGDWQRTESWLRYRDII
jgi:hypothetical protein